MGQQRELIAAGLRRVEALVRPGDERHRRALWRRRKPALLLALGLLVSTGAYAHLMSAGAGAVNLRLQDATVLIGVPVSVLQGVDDNGDGLLQPQEIKAHRTEILEQLARGFSLSVGTQVAEVREAYLMVSVHAEDGVSTPQIEWWSLLAFKQPVAPTDCAEITVQWFPDAGKAGGDITYSLQFRHGEQLQNAVFSSTDRQQKLTCASSTPAVVQ